MAAYNQQGVGTLGVCVNVKTNVNTAPFEELWRAYWSVMADNIDTSQPPFPSSAGGEALMFRNPIRQRGVPNAANLTPTMMLQLRAALSAAVKTPSICATAMTTSPAARFLSSITLSPLL